jgi:hypothetical protein
MTLFRNAVITNTRLVRECEHERACGSSGRSRRNLSKTVYGRWALRNHLRSRLRQKLGRQ